jgi:hypothetical protein
LRTSDVARRVRAMRHRAVAHHELVADGKMWRLWLVQDAGLKYTDPRALIDNSRRYIDAAEFVVRNAGYSHESGTDAMRGYAEEFWGALKKGIRAQKIAKGVRRLDMASSSRRRI